MNRKIVCLCGSTKFKEAFEEANKQETLKGNIVLGVGWFGHCESTPISNEQKEKLDEVIILNVGKYIGESTKRELSFAVGLQKLVRFLEKPEY